MHESQFAHSSWGGEPQNQLRLESQNMLLLDNQRIHVSSIKLSSTFWPGILSPTT